MKQGAKTGRSLKQILGDLSQCKTIYWIDLAAITLFYLSYLPFNMVASGYFIEKWYPGPEMSLTDKLESVGHFLSIPLIMSSVFFPIFGLSVDKIGHRIHLLALSGTLLCLAYILFLTSSPLIPLILLGLAYGIFGTVLWPMLVFLVPQRIFVSCCILLNNLLGHIYGLDKCPSKYIYDCIPTIFGILGS